MSEPELDSRGGPTDTTGQGIEPPEGKEPRKQGTSKKKLNDLDQDPEKRVDRRLFPGLSSDPGGKSPS